LESGDVVPRVRLGLAYLANARALLGDGDDKRSEHAYEKAAEQFEYLQRKLAKKQNAAINTENGLCAAYAGLSRWDQAQTVCERIVAEPKLIDPNGSAWYNLAEAYFNRKQLKKARSAVTEYTRLRKTEARGFILLGD